LIREFAVEKGSSCCSEQTCNENTIG